MALVSFAGNYTFNAARFRVTQSYHCDIHFNLI